jgi:uroporphyrinogen decarboxylase
MQISFTPEFAERLTRSAGLDESLCHNPHGGGNPYLLERRTDQDMLLTSVGWANCYYQQQEEYTDDWGIGWKKCEYETKFGKGKYTEIARHPLSDDKAIDSYCPPDPHRDELYQEAGSMIEHFREQYYIVGVAVTTVFETGWALRGLEKMLIDLALNPDLANRILDIPYNYHLEAAKRLTQMGVDMIWIGDDVGTQKGMLMDPGMWRKYFKPRMTNFIGTIKDINPALKVAYHSDGQIFEIIEDLIEAGVDVLNPVQPACMDPAKVNELYGDRLCFWGTIDEQQTLPFGTPDDVRSEVETRLKTIGKNGGLILGPTHHVQLDTPMENFHAMLEAITTPRF